MGPKDRLVGRAEAMGTAVTRKEFMRRTAVLGASGMSLATLLAACGESAPSGTSSATGAATTAATRGGVAQIAVTGWNVEQVLDPAKASGTVELLWSGLLFDNLVRTTPAFAYEPALAERWDVSEDATEYVFTLREAEFHDGSALRPQDVVHTFRRLLDPKLASPAQSSLATYLDARSIQATGPREVTFRLKSPNAFFLALAGGYNGRIVKEGTADTDRPIGTGPFRLERLVKGRVFESTRNPGYWIADRPYLDGVRIVNVPEDETRVQSVLSGDSHLAMQVQPIAAKQVEQSSNASLLRLANAFFPVMVVRAGVEKAYDDPDVARALKLALDRQKLLDTVQLGYGSLGADMPLPRDDAFYPDGFEPIGYDPDEAGRVMRATGIKSIKVYTAPVGPGVVELPVAFADLARASGIEVEVEKVPGDTYWTTAYQKHPVFMSYWARQAPSMIVPQAITSDGVYNESAFSDASVDAQLAEAARSLDVADQKRLYGEALTTFAEQGGWVVPFWNDALWPAKKELSGVELGWINLATMTNASLS